MSMTSSEALNVRKLWSYLIYVMDFMYQNYHIFEELSDPCKTSTNKEKCKCDVMMVTIYRV